MSIRIPQRVLVAPSGFKESLDAAEVASAIAAGVRRALPGVRVDAVPVIDGGEGTARLLAGSGRGRLREATVTGPTGDRVRSHWAEIGPRSRTTAVVEMAAAAGLALVPPSLRDPGATTTYGVGELIGAALDGGARSILVGCGDSGTCDGGAGALQALGARILDGDGRDIGRGGAELIRARSLDLSGIDPRLEETEIVLACNPHNVLTGEHGVAQVFGPQKGASPQQVRELSAALDNWAAVLERDGRGGVDVRTGLGSGASGGLGAGLAAGIGAVLRSRFDALLDSGLSGIDLDRRIAKSDLVITAEGSIDFQTPHGKVPAEVARRAQARGVPVLALAGSLGQGAPTAHDVGIGAMASIITVPMELSEAVANGAPLLADAAERSIRMMLLGAAVAARSEDRYRKKAS